MERYKFKKKLFADFVAIVGAWFAAYALRFYVFHGVGNDSLQIFSKLSVLAYLVSETLLFTNRLYDKKNDNDWVATIQGLFAVSLESFFVISTVFYFLFSTKVSRLTLVFFFPIEFVFLCISRNYVKYRVEVELRRGSFKKSVLLVGYGKRLEEAAEDLRLEEQGEFNGVLVGQYLGKKVIEGMPQVVGSSLEEVVKKFKVDIVLISFPPEDFADSSKVYNEGLELLNANVYLLPDIPKAYAGATITNIGQTPAIKINSKEITTQGLVIKRIFDIVVCSIAVVILSPVYVLLALLVKLTSKGPVFFKQKRVTVNGKVFNMLKFRSMRIDMPELNGPHFTEENDPRVTKIGKLMRKTSLDELPQFFNVIGGSMSLIGPRPERPELVEKFKKEIPGYDIRHKMKAGISGWAQVNGLRGNTSIPKRIDYDLFYINHWTTGFDLKIIFLTFFKGFINKNAY